MEVTHPHPCPGYCGEIQYPHTRRGIEIVKSDYIAKSDCDG